VIPMFPATHESLARHQPIPIDAGSGVIRAGSIDGTAEYRVTLQVLPTPALRVEGAVSLSGEGTWLLGEVSDDFSIRPPLSDEFVELVLQRVTGFGTFEVVAQPRTPSTLIGRASGLGAVTFGLHNLPSLYQPIWTGRYDGPCPANRILIEIGDWIAILYARTDFGVVDQHLRQFGTFAITHLGTLRRLDGQQFAYREGEPVLKTLFWLLSFARGAWGGPVAFALLDPQARLVGQVWEVPRLDPAVEFVSWLDSLRADAIQDIAPRLHALLVDDLSTRTIRRAIHWYISTNKQSGGLEGSIVLCQNALELLAWDTLVKTTAVLSRQGFKSLSASDRIRLLLREYGIPLVIPTDLGALVTEARKRKWVDSAHAFTALRNTIVHPDDDSTTASLDPISKFQAWGLGLWILELALLRRLEYKGTYRCRLNGLICPVPWVA
jgi:hypothetical protein